MLGLLVKCTFIILTKFSNWDRNSIIYESTNFLKCLGYVDIWNNNWHKYLYIYIKRSRMNVLHYIRDHFYFSSKSITPHWSQNRRIIPPLQTWCKAVATGNQCPNYLKKIIFLHKMPVFTKNFVSLRRNKVNIDYCIHTRYWLFFDVKTQCFS